MNFEVEINGTLRRVSIEAVGSAGPEGGRFRVVIDQKAVDVDARPTDLGLSLIVGEQRHSIDVAVTERANGEKFVQLPHVDVVATVDGRRFRRGRAEGQAADGEQRITAPMPGRVVKILVTPGETVAARQPLVVVGR
jgi:biotin carboxyl carrier protein